MIFVRVFFVEALFPLWGGTVPTVPTVPTVGGNASTLYVREEFKSWKIHSKDVFSAAEQGAAENSSMLVFSDAPASLALMIVCD